MPKIQISGQKLIELLLADGWEQVRQARHGIWFRKTVGGKTRFTTVKDTNKIIPQTTLGQILSKKQTGLGTTGLRALVEGKSTTRGPRRHQEDTPISQREVDTGVTRRRRGRRRRA